MFIPKDTLRSPSR